MTRLVADLQVLSAADAAGLPERAATDPRADWTRWWMSSPGCVRAPRFGWPRGWSR